MSSFIPFIIDKSLPSITNLLIRNLLNGKGKYLLCKAPISFIHLSIIDLMFSSSDVKVNCFGCTSNGVKVNCCGLNFLLMGISYNFLTKSSPVCLTAFSHLCIMGSNSFS